MQDKREIKFRVWDKKQKKMSFSFGFEDIFAESRGDVLIMKENDYSEEDFLLEDLENLVFMQFTGLEDKNGKEIYEGDILDVAGFSIVPNTPYVVKWNGCGFNLFGDNIGEVIGNIYENPNLLSDTNETAEPNKY